jgi:serine/threonine protein kinase/Tfp pilus assembly protein PilF
MNTAPTDFDLGSLVRERIDQWRAGAVPDTLALINEHPEIQRDKSLVLDLIFEEVSLKRQSGDTIVQSTVCERFPAYRGAIAHMLSVQEGLDPHFSADNERLDWPQPGECFLGYDVVAHLGRGALARVYLAREPALGNRLVVIKVSLHGGREAEMLGKLSHASIVPVYSVQCDEESGWTLIVMPLMGVATALDLIDSVFERPRWPENGSVVAAVGQAANRLPEVLREAPAAEVREWNGPYSDAIARFGLQLAEGLHAAHQAGVMHRDIKPSNVLLAWSGRPMLLDFNLSTEHAEDGVGGKAGGTLPYMAPELIAAFLSKDSATLKRFDPRGDVYSLGAVLYQLLTGDVAAKPEGSDHLPPDAYLPWLASKQQPPVAPRSIQPHVDRRLEAIVLRCLATDPAARYATADELAQDLRAYLGWLPRLERFVRRRPWTVGLSLAAALLVVFAAAGIAATRQPYYERLYDVALEYFDRGDYPAAQQAIEQALVVHPDWIEAEFALGQLLRSQGAWAEARKEFLAMADENPQWGYALAAQCAMDDGQYGDAYRDFRRAYNAGNRHRGVLLRYAHTAKLEGDFYTAFAIYKEVIDANADDLDALLGRADAYLASGDPKKAISAQALADVTRACEIAPTSVRSLYIAMLVLMRTNDRSPEVLERGTRYMETALTQGLSIRQAKPLPFYELALAQSSALKPGDRLMPLSSLPDEPLPNVADWHVFQSLVDRAPAAP